MSQQQQKEQIKKVSKAIHHKNVFELRRLSRNGFVTNELRKKAWPLLLGCGNNETESDNKNDNQDKETKHNYYDQIKKDAIRSMHHFDVTKNYSLKERQREQEALERILNGIFMNNKNLHYTQGFHDMCSVFYIVCGENLGQKLSENLAKRHMRDLVRENMNVYQFILKLLFPLLSLVDIELYNILSPLSSIFALSWLLTWFAHNIGTFNDISRLYDFFLSTHPLMPLYFSVSLLIQCKSQLYKINKIENGGPLDQGRLHQFFQDFHWNINIDKIINKSDHIFSRYPPHDFYRQYFIDDLSNLPKDSPFLAKNINEIENMKSKYSGYDLNSIWCYQNPKFWRYIAIPMLTAVVIFHVANSHLTK
eukprot:457641_1